jgi:NAD+ kinase
MSWHYKNVGVVAKPSYSGLSDLLIRISHWLQERGARLLYVSGAGLPGGVEVSLDEFTRSTDLIMVLGGDGTFLAGGRLAIARDVPVLGVNLGRLGFLTEVTVEELFPTLEKIEKGPVVFETRHLLQARIKKGDQLLFEGHVINDAVINKASIARMLEMEARINGNFLALYKADGLIISTPTGSTAYSLAAGGPIVFPTMEAIVMTPICPHSLNHRPVVIPDHFSISIHMQQPERVNLTLDGQIGRALQEGEYIEIARSPHVLEVIKSPFKNYFDILKSKLRWAEI